MKHSILIVEDDFIAAKYLEQICMQSSIKVLQNINNAYDALCIIKDQKPSLVLLDIMIDGPVSGTELAMQIRACNRDIVIIFITAYSNPEMLESALNVNAYGYLLKPYRDAEIITTILMALNSTKTSAEKVIVTFNNNFSFNAEKKLFKENGKPIILSKKLFALLYTLFQNRGSVVSNKQLAQAIWCEEKNVNTLRALVYRLKIKLPKLDLKSSSNWGYILC